MKTPELETVRDKHSGIHQREKRPTRWENFWTKLNSPIVTWLLTALLGSLIAYTYANLQSCLKDGDERASKLNRLVSEMHGRYALIIAAVGRATTADDLSERLLKVPFTRLEFKDAAMASLSAEFGDLMSYVRPAELRERGMRDAIRYSGLTDAELGVVWHSLVIGRPPEGLTDANLATFKALAPKFERLISGSVKFNAEWYPVAYCGVPNAFLALWRSRGPIVEYVPRPANNPF